MVYAMATIGIISFVVYGHHMFTTGADPLFRFIVMLTTMLVAVPTGIKIFNWLATMTGGSIVLKTPMVFALGTVITFTIGGITGIICASIPVDVGIHDGYFVVAHFHYVLVGGTVFSFIAGVYYWYPKMVGKIMNEKLGLLHFALTFISFNVAFYPMHNVGLSGMPRRYATYDASLTELNQMITIGAFVFGFVQLIFVYNVLYSYKYGKEAGDNPWDGWSLEWATSSPPPHNSFTEIPTLKVAEEEDKTHSYVITVDVARGQGLDYSAFTVFDITNIPYKIVAKYKNNHVAPLVFPNIINIIGKKYNNAYILIEVNDIGSQVSDVLHHDLEYENLFSTAWYGRHGQQLSGFVGGKRDSQFGVRTTKSMKKIGCSNLKALIEDDKLLIPDYDIISELTTFVSSADSFSAEEGANDDLIITLVLFAWMVDQQYFKDLSNQNIRSNLYKNQLNELEDMTTPFGIISNGLKEDDREIDNMGNVWVNVE